MCLFSNYSMLIAGKAWLACLMGSKEKDKLQCNLELLAIYGSWAAHLALVSL